MTRTTFWIPDQNPYSPTLKPGPISVSAPCPFSAISVVLLPCSQVFWQWPFKQILLQMRGAMTTLKRSRVEERSTLRTSLRPLSHRTSRWRIREEGIILASFTAAHTQPKTFTLLGFSFRSSSETPALFGSKFSFSGVSCGGDSVLLTSRFLSSNLGGKQASLSSCFHLQTRASVHLFGSLSSLFSLFFPKCRTFEQAEPLPPCGLLLWRELQGVRMWVREREKEEREERGAAVSQPSPERSWQRASLQSFKWFPCWLFLPDFSPSLLRLPAPLLPPH